MDFSWEAEVCDSPIIWTQLLVPFLISDHHPIHMHCPRPPYTTEKHLNHRTATYYIAINISGWISSTHAVLLLQRIITATVIWATEIDSKPPKTSGTKGVPQIAPSTSHSTCISSPPSWGVEMFTITSLWPLENLLLWAVQPLPSLSFLFWRCFWCSPNFFNLASFRLIVFTVSQYMFLSEVWVSGVSINFIDANNGHHLWIPRTGWKTQWMGGS